MNGRGNEPAFHGSDSVPSVTAAGGADAAAFPLFDPGGTRDDRTNLGPVPLRLPGSSMPAQRSVPVARIYQPAPSPMQCAPFGRREWVLEFAPASPRDIEPLMGWTSGQDPFAAVTQLRFRDLQSAIDFAERQGWHYLVREPPVRRFKPKSYADNFRYDLASALTRAQRPWDGGMSIAGTGGANTGPAGSPRR
jgi:hypothetical protein